MKSNFITLIISSVVSMAVLWIRQKGVWDASTHGHYYVTAILVISCLLMAITLFRMIRLHRHRPMAAKDADQKTTDQHRLHFRLQFNEPPHPIFVQRTDNRHPAAGFTCPVRNISETGIGLGCTGVYANGQTVQGEIIFGSGRTAPVNGTVIRQASDRTCLQLHCAIDPPLLMAEQREQIAAEKGKGPRPAVSKTVLDTTGRILPSHSPKGICRLKRF